MTPEEERSRHLERIDLMLFWPALIVTMAAYFAFTLYPIAHGLAWQAPALVGGSFVWAASMANWIPRCLYPIGMGLSLSALAAMLESLW